MKSQEFRIKDGSIYILVTATLKKKCMEEFQFLCIQANIQEIVFPHPELGAINGLEDSGKITLK